MSPDGKLYVVATPIGNLSDITFRAIDTLKSVDIIACENKDRHIKLLNHYEIKKHLIEYSPANEKNSTKGIIQLLKQGKNVALVSDAGVPALSDPGKILVDEAVRNNITVIPIPGPSALTSLLSVSGFSTDRVVFLGFLSKSPGKQSRELGLFKNINSVIVLFVSQYQLKKILILINKLFGNVEIIIAREMTKLNEEFIRGKIENIIKNDITERGEFTLAIMNRV